MNVQDFMNFGEEALSPSFEGDIYKPPATDLSGYYTKTQVDTTFGGYYTKVQIDTQMGAKAPIASPTFTGIVNAPKLNLGSLYGGTNYLATGNADAASYTAFNIEMRGWWGMGMSTYDGTVKGFYDFRVGKWDTKGGFFKNGVEAVYQDSGYYNININGQAAAAQTLRRDGTNQGPQMTFFWNGQAGQPSWLWGGNDGTSMYVYNPSNFSVAYAANAGAISGVPVGSIVQFTVSSNPDEVNYPVGQILIVWNNASIRPRNEAQTLRVYSGDTQDWCLSTLGTGAILAGTWRAKGVCSNDRQAFQRVS
jgi:hypothetical protein